MMESPSPKAGEERRGGDFGGAGEFPSSESSEIVSITVGLTVVTFESKVWGEGEGRVHKYAGKRSKHYKNFTLLCHRPSTCHT